MYHYNKRIEKSSIVSASTQNAQPDNLVVTLSGVEVHNNHAVRLL